MAESNLLRIFRQGLKRPVERGHPGGWQTGQCCLCSAGLVQQDEHWPVRHPQHFAAEELLLRGSQTKTLGRLGWHKYF